MNDTGEVNAGNKGAVELCRETIHRKSRIWSKIKLNIWNTMGQHVKMDRKKKEMYQTQQYGVIAIADHIQYQQEQNIIQDQLDNKNK